MSVFIVCCCIVTIKICYLALPFSVTGFRVLYEVFCADLLWLDMR